MTRSIDSRRSVELLLPLLILALGALLRFYALGRFSLWLDEFTSLERARLPLTDILQGKGFDNHTPPFYYLLLHLWLYAAPETEAGMRSLSAFFDCLNIWLIFTVFSAQFSRRSGLIAMSIYAFSEFAIYYAQEARPYTLLVTASLLTYYAALKADEFSVRRGIILFFSAVCGFYTHYYYILFLGGLCLALLIIKRRNFRELVRWSAPLFLAGLAFLPWVGKVLLLASSGGQTFRNFSAAVLPYTFFRFSAGYSVMPLVAGLKDDFGASVRHFAPLIAVYSAVFAAALIAGLWNLLRRHKGEALLVLFAAAFSPGAAALISLKVPMLSERYLFIVYPFFCLLIALSLRGRSGSVLAGALAGLMLFSTWQHYANHRFGKEQWRDAAALISSGESGAALVYVQPDFTNTILGFYLPGALIRPLHDGEPPPLPSKKEFWLVERGGSPSRKSDFARFEPVFERLFPFENGLSVTRFRIKGH